MNLFNIFRKKEQKEAYLLVFHASWCGHSRRFLEDINKNKNITYTLIDVDKEDELSSKFAVRSVPTTILVDAKNNEKIESWIGNDTDDPGKKIISNYIKKEGYKIIPYIIKENNEEKPISKTSDNEKEAITLIESVIGTAEKPAKVEKQKLQDGAIYTGEALLQTNGYYLPHGYGKKIISKDIEMTGHWVNGLANGMCYCNMHFAMVTGHFVDNHPRGWCLSIEGGRGFVFGVFKNDDCVVPIGDSVLWMMQIINFNLKTSYKTGQILVGEIKRNKAQGFFFMNNGDVYVGTDTDLNMGKTGVFFKFSKDGYVKIGRFEKGELMEIVPAERVIIENLGDVLTYKKLDLNKKYF